MDPFISRKDLSDKFGQDLTTDDAALIAIDAASDIVRTLAEQTFNEVTDDEITLDGTGTDALLLPERPVTEVTTVTENDEELVVDDDYKLNGNGILLRMPTASDDYGWFRHTWRCGRQNVSVTYSHGYAADDLPRDIRGVALNIAVRLFASGNISFEQLGDYSVRYENASADLTTTEKIVLAKYRQAKGS